MGGGVEIEKKKDFFFEMKIPSERSKLLVDVLNGFLFLQITKKKPKKQRKKERVLCDG